MPKNTLAAFFTAGTIGFLGGMLSLLIASILFSNRITSASEDDTSICIMLGIFIDVVGPFFFCTLFLLPLAAIEKRKIEESPFINLIKRYTPILTLPFGVLFFFVFTSYNHESDKSFLLTTVTNIFGICAFSLWSFIKQIKST
jgi:hypothetical protein